MSRMLTFYDAAWAKARQLSAAGSRAAALAALAPLLDADPAPLPLRVSALRLAARLHAECERYGRARRLLRRAAELAPAKAAIQHEIGVCFEDDPYGCDERAARRFKAAVQLDPKPKFLAALGRALVRVNKVKAGVKRLLAAAEGAPSDAKVLAVVTDGLRDAKRPRAAYRLVARAKFLAPRDTAIEKLWNDVRFELARASAPRRKQPAGPRMLPFLRLTDGTVRQDAGSKRPAPHFPRLQAFRNG